VINIVAREHLEQRLVPLAPLGQRLEAVNVGRDKDSEKRQRRAIEGYAKAAG
jgi:hypothetical protein